MENLGRNYGISPILVFTHKPFSTPTADNQDVQIAGVDDEEIDNEEHKKEREEDENNEKEREEDENNKEERFNIANELIENTTEKEGTVRDDKIYKDNNHS
jgi:hypothetical protein